MSKTLLTFFVGPDEQEDRVVAAETVQELTCDEKSVAQPNCFPSFLTIDMPTLKPFASATTGALSVANSINPAIKHHLHIFDIFQLLFHLLTFDEYANTFRGIYGHPHFYSC